MDRSPDYRVAAKVSSRLDGAIHPLASAGSKLADGLKTLSVSLSS
ncbi:MAG: hypothetical protein R3C56_21110 [Pirellulaceae bacterium]